MDMTQGLSVEDVEELATSLEMGKGKSEFEDNSPYILLALLGPHRAGPMMDDGWFAADFAMAHKIYRNLPREQTWMCAVDMLEEVGTGGPYFWGYPKHSRLQVLVKDDPRFYSLSSPRSLLSDFKEKLSETVARLSATDKLLLLIFAHGDEEQDINGMKAGILVGEGDQEGFGVMYASKLNSMLSSCPAKVTLITSSSFGGAWHHELRTPYSRACSDETLSVPTSKPASGSGANGDEYFWEAMWYELSRLGLRLPEKNVEENYKFKRGVCRVQDRLKDLMMFTPEPTISVASKEEWEHHFRKVIQLDDLGNQTHLNIFTIPPNPNDEGSESHSGIRNNASVAEKSGGARNCGGHENVGGASHVWNTHVSWRLQDSDMHALQSLGSHNETILPSYATPRNERCVPGVMSSSLRLCVIELPALVDYYAHSMPGLHNLPSNIPTFTLLWKYWKMSATKEELEDLRRVLHYRLVQDVKAEEMLSFLNIPRLCSITKFRMEQHQSQEQEPYLRVVTASHLFDKVPKRSPPFRSYRKPMYYLANTAFRNKMDLVWWRESLEACHNYFENFEQHFCKLK